MNKNVKIAIALVTSLFFLWGVSYGLVDVMNKNFQNHLGISQKESGFLQMAYFGAYFVMALPAGWIASRFSYKIGIIVGLALYAIGSLLIIPATNMASFSMFLFAFFVLACGLGALETNANPYITKLGDEKNASFRINAAQSFNGFGSFLGPIIGGALFLSITHSAKDASSIDKEQALIDNMFNVQMVYVGIALIVFLILLAFVFTKLPEGKEVNKDFSNSKDKAILVFTHKHFSLGVLAQFLYIAAQVGAGAFFINYATDHVKNLSDELAAYYFSAALIAFMMGRIITTPFMKKYKAENILALYSILNVLVSIALYFVSGMFSVYLLIFSFFLMSISFPTIFAISTKNLALNQVKLGGSILVMSIVGGAISPTIIGHINDIYGTSLGLASLAICYLYVAWYAKFGTLKNDN